MNDHKPEVMAWLLGGCLVMAACGAALAETGVDGWVLSWCWTWSSAFAGTALAVLIQQFHKQ